MAILKRSREDYETSLAMANYLIMLSRGSSLEPTTGRVFECKTCNRRFPSFQALGGHRASHKKPKTESENSDHDQVGLKQGKPKTHECSICGVEFAVGQALGGHMRRHRAALAGSQRLVLPSLSLSLAVGSGILGQEKKGGNNSTSNNNNIKEGDSHGKRRVKCLDLNLTPLENGLLDVGMVSPILC